MDLHKRKGRSLLTLSLTIVPGIPVVIVCVYSAVYLIQLGTSLSTTLPSVYQEVRFIASLANLVGDIHAERSAGIYALHLVDECIRIPVAPNVTAGDINVTAARFYPCRILLRTNRAFLEAIRTTDSDISELLQVISSSRNLATNINILLMASADINQTRLRIWNINSLLFEFFVDVTSIDYGSAVTAINSILYYKSLRGDASLPSHIVNGFCAMLALLEAQTACEYQYIHGIKYLSTTLSLDDNDMIYISANDSLLSAQLRQSISCNETALIVYRTIYKSRFKTASLDLTVPNAVESFLPKSIYEYILEEILEDTETTLKKFITDEYWNEEFLVYRGLFDSARGLLTQGLIQEGLDPMWQSCVGLCVFYGLAAAVQIVVALLIWEDAVLMVKNVEGYSKVARAHAMDIEKKHERVNMLLSEMLPKAVVEQLKRGELVEAEEFEVR